MKHPVTVLEAGPRTDRFGDVVYDDWGNPSRRKVNGWLTQKDSVELSSSSANAEASGRMAIVTTDTLILPAGDPITEQSRVETSVGVFAVDGKPKRAQSPRGEHHVEVRLKAVDG